MKKILLSPIALIISLFEHIGRYFDLMIKTLRSFTSWHLYLGFLPDHMIRLGVATIPIVIVTGLFSGMVTSVQTAYQLESGFIPESYVGGIVGVTVLMELSPMITALVMTGRVGASITAEIGTMRVTEQIDALESLSYDPVAYLIFPRIVAAMVMFPLLIAVADFFGILGGIWVTTNSLGISVDQFMEGLREWFHPIDYWFGIIKGFFFGLAITSIACFYGFNTKGGAEGVGKTTTATVVVSCVAIVFLDYILGELILL